MSIREIKSRVLFGSLITVFPAEADDKSLRLLGLLPTSGVGWTGGRKCLAPIDMALDDIKTNTDLLQGYNLTYSWYDTQCNPGPAVYNMFQQMYTNPPYIMLLGGGCSTGSEATAQVSYLWNVTQIRGSEATTQASYLSNATPVIEHSYVVVWKDGSCEVTAQVLYLWYVTQLSFGSSSPVLSDRKRFPKFFRLAGPDQMLNPARIALMDHFNWKKVSTINQAEEFFSVVTDDFVNRVKSTNISILSQEIFANDPTTRVENLKNHDARIIMTAMYEDKARKMLCAAYKAGLYGRKIVWVFVGWFSTEFWRTPAEDVDCTADQMDATVEGSLLTSFYYYNPVEQRGIANMTAKEFTVRHLAYPGYLEDLAKFNFVAAPCYDHIWVAALALDCADKKLKAMGHPKSLDQFTYADSDINELIFQCMGNTSMTGVSGNIVFGEGADPRKNVKIEQIQGSARKVVGLYRMDLNPRSFEWFGKGIRWKDGNIPRDSTYVITEEVTIPTPVYVAMTVFSVLGIVLAIALLVFNVVFRKNATVKMSSPNINNVLLLGCIICYCTVFMKPTETSNSVICQARVFCFSLGFTITFGSLFSKTWRVYRIFTNKKLLRMTIKDYQLMAIICGLISVVLVVLISWEIVSPQQMVVKSLDKEVYVMGNDAEVRPYVRMCTSESASYFLWTLYVLEGTLLSFGAFLAWETRHVKIEALNDSHQIGLCLYNVVVLSAVGLTLNLLLDQQVIILYGMTSGCVIIGTTVIQVVVFVPKVLAVINKSAVGDISDNSDRGVSNLNVSSSARTAHTQSTDA